MRSPSKFSAAALVALAAVSTLGGCSFGGSKADDLPRVVTPEQARAAEAAQQYERSAELWYRLYVDGGGETLEPYLGYGRSMLAAGDVRSACALVEEGLGVFPREVELRVLHGEILESAGFQRAAERAYETAVALDPENHAAQLGLGRVRVELGLCHKALEPLRRAATLQPDDPQSLRLFALAAEDIGDPVDAFVARRRLLLLDTNPTAFRYVSTARLSFHPKVRAAFPGAEDLARPWIEEAIALNPQDSEAHYLLALDLEAHGELERAREHYLRAIEVDPGNLAALTDLAAHYHRAGDRLEADRFARLALQLERDRRRREILESYLAEPR